MDELTVRHQRACDAFTHVARAVVDEQWSAPTPCPEWDARALVEHVIGFHDFLLLRPLGVRAHRPREGPADRWVATSNALFAALDDDAALEQSTELPGDGQSTPRTMLAALTTDVLVHTWDLARATGVDGPFDEALCTQALDAVRAGGVTRDGSMIGPEEPVAGEAPPSTRLAAYYGRDPSWTPSSGP